MNLDDESIKFMKSFGITNYSENTALAIAMIEKNHIAIKASFKKDGVEMHNQFNFVMNVIDKLYPSADIDVIKKVCFKHGIYTQKCLGIYWLVISLLLCSLVSSVGFWYHTTIDDCGIVYFGIGASYILILIFFCWATEKLG